MNAIQNLNNSLLNALNNVAYIIVSNIRTGRQTETNLKDILRHTVDISHAPIRGLTHDTICQTLYANRKPFTLNVNRLSSPTCSSSTATS